MKPQNFEERLVWYFIIGTYGLYLIGGQYPFNALLAWVLFLCVLYRLYKPLLNPTEDIPVEKKIHIPWVLWVWTIGMLVMLVVTIVNHDNFQLGIKRTFIGVLHWGVTWALLALFPWSGCLNIRPQIIYRAVCILCLQSLLVIPIVYLAYKISYPPLLYNSPLEKLLKNGPIYYQILLYGFDEESASQEARFFLFAPWGPALGLVSSLYFFISLQEKNKKWRFIGVVSSVLMAFISGSRSATVFPPAVAILVWIITNIARPGVQIATGLASFLAGIFSTFLLGTAKDFIDGLLGSRASSTRVRATLARIAFDRWKEAPIWGHATRARGVYVTRGMPIGSHHTWMGALFVKGAVGFVALAVPMLLSFIDLVIKAQKSAIAKLGLSIFLTLFFFSFAENLETLAYVVWPSLILLGMGFKGEVEAPASSSQEKEIRAV